MNTRISMMALACVAAGLVMAQAPRQWSLQELFQRNVGTKQQQDTAFPPHKILGNLYYVGTQSFGTFLITTPQGHILINTDYERTVPIIKESIEKLGFKFSDIKIILGSHAHADHMEGDAMAKEMTGAQVMAMAQDVPALERMRPGGKPHPIDRVLHDGDRVDLGGTTLTAHLTPGHTKGCTTWTAKISEGGKSYDVVIIGSVGVNPGFQLVNNAQNPGIAEEYKQAFRVLRSLHADVPLGSHPAMYRLEEKYPLINKESGKKDSSKAPNPFIDPAGYKAELDIVEEVFERTLREQTAAAQAKQGR
jgi:metallo-beta-lactamase class B